MPRNYQQRAEIRRLRKENQALKDAFLPHPQTWYPVGMTKRRSHYQETIAEDGKLRVQTHGAMVRYICQSCAFPFFSPENRFLGHSPICPTGCGGKVHQTWTRLEEIVFIEEKPGHERD